MKAFPDEIFVKIGQQASPKTRLALAAALGWNPGVFARRAEPAGEDVAVLFESMALRRWNKPPPLAHLSAQQFPRCIRIWPDVTFFSHFHVLNGHIDGAELIVGGETLWRYTRRMSGVVDVFRGRGLPVSAIPVVLLYVAVSCPGGVRIGIDTVDDNLNAISDQRSGNVYTMGGTWLRYAHGMTEVILDMDESDM